MIYNKKLKIKTIHKFSNLLIKKGKRALATSTILNTLFFLKKNTKKNPINIMNSAIKSLTPGVTTRKTVIAGRLYHLPCAITTNKALYFGCNWLQTGARETKEGKSSNLYQKLCSEFLRVLRKKGQSLLLMKQHNKVVSDNRPFLRFVRKKFKPRLPRKVWLRKQQLLYLKRKKRFKPKFSSKVEYKFNNRKLKGAKKTIFNSKKYFTKTKQKANRIINYVEKKESNALKSKIKKSQIPITKEQKDKIFTRLKTLYGKYSVNNNYMKRKFVNKNYGNKNYKSKAYINNNFDKNVKKNYENKTNGNKNYGNSKYEKPLEKKFEKKNDYNNKKKNKTTYKKI